ncbi:hypothetical protein F4780DRAFT_775520 [Xylariomycetidae sp. FL0641]|nr:hypothetical protein F4780DRAFT_775520 [Xylariomycetidae sp. FL0641]
MPKFISKLKPEAFWPSTMDKECDKAARILNSFTDTNNSKAKIPSSVIAQAHGLAIFTGLRAGMWLSGAGGSGVVVARQPDGSWSPPSGFVVRSGGFGIVGGVDIYDCVCVLNTAAAVAAYTHPKVSLGSEVAVAAGPLGGGSSEAEKKPVWSYTKSRGLWGGLTVDGTAIIARPDANAAFYDRPGVTVEQILRGEVTADGETETGWPAGARQLTEVLKAAEGRGADADVMKALGDEPTPGDLVLAPEGGASNTDAVQDGAVKSVSVGA